MKLPSLNTQILIGAVAGAFVHERHATNRELPRLAGRRIDLGVSADPTGQDAVEGGSES